KRLAATARHGPQLLLRPRRILLLRRLLQMQRVQMHLLQEEHLPPSLPSAGCCSCCPVGCAKCAQGCVCKGASDKCSCCA
ncbi:hypothetical protein J0S82_001705, partial [Galemys pyrenaicus]